MSHAGELRFRETGVPANVDVVVESKKIEAVAG
jgi:hypothetical protein